MSEFLIAAVVIAIGLSWNAFKHFRTRISGPKLKSADYVVFRTKPILLPLLRDDMAEAGWALADTSLRGTETLYRFEKSRAEAADLARLLAVDGLMQRTANREAGTDVVLAVDAFCARKIAHA